MNGMFQNDRLSYWLICSLIVSVTILIKFAVPFGSNQLFFAFFTIYAAVGIGLVSHRLILNPKMLAAYLLMMGTLFTTQLIGGTIFSFSSVLMLTLIHLPYVFRLRDGALPPYAEMLFYQKLMVIVAILGIIQFFAQYVIGYQYVYFLDALFPQQFIMQNFHGLNPLNRDGIYKSSGIFIQEPSNFSQLLALALIIEMVFLMNWRRIALYLFALALTFSGTGLITLLVLTPFYLIAKRRFVLLFALACFVVSAPVWAPFVGLEKTVNRVAEFGNQHSSAYARFISPYKALEDKIFPEGALTTLTGKGAGSMFRQMGQGVDYEVAMSTWGKIIFEYGVIGGVAYFLFMGYAMFGGRKNLFLVFALTIQFYLLGEHLFPPTVHGLILALLVWSHTNRDQKPDIQEGFLFPRLTPLPPSPPSSVPDSA